MNEPRVSVIIPVYNSVSFMREAVESVLTQTYTNLEIIIVDDGSNDGSERLCDEYGRSDRRIVVIHQKQKGLSGARNAGLKIMSGELVAFLDADDIYTCDMIARMVSAMERERADMAICGYATCKTEGRMNNVSAFIPLRYQGRILSSQEALNMYARGGIGFAMWNKIYKAVLWRNLRFPEGHVYEDKWIQHYLLEEASVIVTIPGVHVIHRKHGVSITRTHTKENFRDFILAQKQICKYIEANTPEVFTGKSVEKWYERCIKALIIQWGYLPFIKRTSEKELYCEVISEGNYCCSKTTSLSAHLAFWGFRKMPLLCPTMMRLRELLHTVWAKNRYPYRWFFLELDKLETER